MIPKRFSDIFKKKNNNKIIKIPVKEGKLEYGLKESEVRAVVLCFGKSELATKVVVLEESAAAGRGEERQRLMPPSKCILFSINLRLILLFFKYWIHTRMKQMI